MTHLPPARWKYLQTRGRRCALDLRQLSLQTTICPPLSSDFNLDDVDVRLVQFGLVCGTTCVGCVTDLPCLSFCHRACTRLRPCGASEWLRLEQVERLWRIDSLWIVSTWAWCRRCLLSADRRRKRWMHPGASLGRGSLRTYRTGSQKGDHDVEKK